MIYYTKGVLTRKTTKDMLATENNIRNYIYNKLNGIYNN